MEIKSKEQQQKIHITSEIPLKYSLDKTKWEQKNNNKTSQTQIIYLPALYPSAMVMEIRVVKLYNAIMMANEMMVSISIELRKLFEWDSLVVEFQWFYINLISIFSYSLYAHSHRTLPFYSFLLFFSHNNLTLINWFYLVENFMDSSIFYRQLVIE